MTTCIRDIDLNERAERIKKLLNNHNLIENSPSTVNENESKDSKLCQLEFCALNDEGNCKFVKGVSKVYLKNCPEIYNKL